jgi:hypothetical protein
LFDTHLLHGRPEKADEFPGHGNGRDLRRALAAMR